MKRMLLVAGILCYGFAAWSWPGFGPMALPPVENVEPAVDVAGAPLDLLNPQFREDVDQFAVAMAALQKVRDTEAAVEASAEANDGQPSQKTADELTQARSDFMEVSLPEQNPWLFGMAPVPPEQAADADDSAVIYDVSRVITCNPDPSRDTIIHVNINPKVQRLSASFPNGNRMDSIKISSAGVNWDKRIKRYRMFLTPVGCYHGVEPILHAHSSSYENAPMPDSLFWLGRLYAIHGVYGKEIAQLGTIRSHGCIRTDPTSAAELFRGAEQNGKITYNVSYVKVHGKQKKVLTPWIDNVWVIVHQ